MAIIVIIASTDDGETVKLKPSQLYIWNEARYPLSWFDIMDVEEIISYASDDARDKFAEVITCPSSVEEFREIQRGLLTEYLNSSADNLGDLRRFPSEIILEICTSLDIKSLFAFSRVNRRCGQIARSLRDYAPVINHALIAINALLRTDVASYFTISQLREVLHEEKCSVCGWFGGFLFLPTLRRCCYRCIKSSQPLSVTSLDQLDTWAAVLNVQVRDLPIPVLKSPQGVYQDGPVEIVAAEAVEKAAPQLKQIFGIAALSPHKFRFMSATKLPYVDPDTGEQESGICCSGCAMEYQDYEFNFIMQQNESSGQRLGMKDPKLRGLTHRQASEVLYSRNEFVEHYRWCWRAQYWMKGLFPDRDVHI